MYNVSDFDDAKSKTCTTCRNLMNCVLIDINCACNETIMKNITAMELN